MTRPLERNQESDHPAGFYCHHFVLASEPENAVRQALRRVRANLDDKTGWLRDGLAELTLEAEEVSQASLLQAFLPINRGHTFYETE